MRSSSSSPRPVARRRASQTQTRVVFQRGGDAVDIIIVIIGRELETQE
jgi:hypothetical protein